MPSNLTPLHLQLAQKLKARTAAPAQAPLRMFRAKVTAVNTGPASVDVQQGTLTVLPGVRYDASLAPTVGMAVWGLTVGGDYQVCGTLA